MRGLPCKLRNINTRYPICYSHLQLHGQRINKSDTFLKIDMLEKSDNAPYTQEDCIFARRVECRAEA